jgi:hypothetical protein
MNVKAYIKYFFIGVGIILLVGLFIQWISPVMLRNGDSIVAFSGWLDPWRQYTIFSRALIYVFAWYSWPKLTHTLVNSAKRKRLAKLERLADTKKIDDEYARIESLIMSWRPKLITVFIIYEAIMLYSIFS